MKLRSFVGEGEDALGQHLLETTRTAHPFAVQQVGERNKRLVDAVIAIIFIAVVVWQIAVSDEHDVPQHTVTETVQVK